MENKNELPVDVEASQQIDDGAVNPVRKQRSVIVSVVSLSLAAAGVTMLLSANNKQPTVVSKHVDSAQDAISLKNIRELKSDSNKGAYERGPSKSPSSGLHKPTWKPTQGSKSGKPVEKDYAEHNHAVNEHLTSEELIALGESDALDKLSAKERSAVEKRIKEAKKDLKASKKSSKSSKSKDEEEDSVDVKSKVAADKKGTHGKDRKLQGDVAAATSGRSVFGRPEGKVEALADPKHQAAQTLTGVSALRQADASAQVQSGPQAQPFAPNGAKDPTKSPSSGVHKPTWKPSAKPVEHSDREPGPKGMYTKRSRSLKEKVEAISDVKHMSSSILPISEIKQAVTPDEVVEEAAAEEVEKEEEVEVVAEKEEEEAATEEESSSEESSSKSKANEKDASKDAGKAKADAIKSAAEPSKSPSSGLHKPTWRPTPKGTLKPVEHSGNPRMLENVAGKSVEQGFERMLVGGHPTKSPSSGLHKPTWKPTMKSGAPVEHRELAAGHPTKSPSSGLHKPTWKPTMKSGAPVETTRTLQVKTSSADRVLVAGHPTKSPSSGLHKPTWKPTMKSGAPVEHRELAAGHPTKSPSSGLHKPTWKPTIKSGAPVEHRVLSAQKKRELGLMDSISALWGSSAKKTDNTGIATPAAVTGPVSYAPPVVTFSSSSTPSKSPSTGIHKPTWKPTTSGKPVEQPSTGKPIEHVVGPSPDSPILPPGAVPVDANLPGIPGTVIKPSTTTSTTVTADETTTVVSSDIQPLSDKSGTSSTSGTHKKPFLPPAAAAEAAAARSEEASKTGTTSVTEPSSTTSSDVATTTTTTTTESTDSASVTTADISSVTDANAAIKTVKHHDGTTKIVKFHDGTNVVGLQDSTTTAATTDAASTTSSTSSEDASAASSSTTTPVVSSATAAASSTFVPV